MQGLLAILFLSALLGFPGLAQAASPLPSSASPQAGDLWINEFLPNPQGADTGREWVELVNRSDHPVSLEGVAVYRGKGSKVATFRGSLPPGGYLTVNSSSSLVNGGDNLVLKRDGELLDEIEYDEAADDVSWIRLTAALGAWTTKPTPGAANKLVAPADAKSERVAIVTAAKATRATTRTGRLPASGPPPLVYWVTATTLAGYAFMRWKISS